LPGRPGEGLPEITLNGIVFNGLARCGHIKNEEICIPFPTPHASGIGSSINAVTDPWFIGVLLKHRTCDGSSFESMNFERIAEGDCEKKLRAGVWTHAKPGFAPTIWLFSACYSSPNIISTKGLRCGQAVPTSIGMISAGSAMPT
jgi:hypothetical protein